jgi:hypothetical protein
MLVKIIDFAITILTVFIATGALQIQGEKGFYAKKKQFSKCIKARKNFASSYSEQHYYGHA